MWQPYSATVLPQVPEADEAELLAPIFNHIRVVIADCNTAHEKWFVDWLANIVQRPHQKSNVAILLYGKQVSAAYPKKRCKRLALWLALWVRGYAIL